MLKKNVLIALRSFKKNKGVTSINILGLAVGISASLVIFVIVRYDFSFDKWEPRKTDTYRVITDLRANGLRAAISLPAPAAIAANIPAIESVAHYINEPFYDPHIATGIKNANPEMHTNVEGIAFADENYFKVFPHQWLAGNASTLDGLNSVVLSKSVANNYFPNISPEKLIGRQMVIQDSIPFKITGIVADLKGRTDFNTKIFLSLKTLTQTDLIKSVMMEGSWTNLDGSSQCLVLLHPGANIAVVNKQLANLYKQNEKGIEPKYQSIGRLQPLSDIHFNMELDGTVSKSSLLNLGILAVMLLLLAVINFVNLSTAMSSLRAKEIGVRKTFGGNNRQIIYQFLTETFLLTLFATVLALLFSPILMYMFKGFIPEGLKSIELLQSSTVLFILTILGAVTLLAGIYPAFILTRFRPALVLKSNIIKSGMSRSSSLRRILTVGQFVIAQVFLIAVIVIGKQIHYVINHDLGFKQNAIVSFTVPDFQLRGESKKFVLLNELKALPGINDASLCSSPPIRNGYSQTEITWTRNGENGRFGNTHVRSVDNQYLSLFGLKLLAGNNIHVDSTARVTDALINESLMHIIGYQRPGEAVGQYIKGGPADSARIVGVLKDFNTMSLHNAIEPTVVFADNRNYGSLISISLNNSNSGGNSATWRSTLAKTSKLFKNLYPNNDIELTFFDEAIKHLYDNDLRVSKLLKWATGLAIFISCLGLLGLVSFMANQRTKEIGIRKVLGASVNQIILLLSKSLIQLVLLASIIAFPLAWYFSHKWLQDFAFKTSLSWWIFLISGIGMMIIALTVLCIRTLKSARANPTESLKVE